MLRTPLFCLLTPQLPEAKYVATIAPTMEEDRNAGKSSLEILIFVDNKAQAHDRVV